MDREIEKVKKEYEEKQRLKKEKRKAKDKDKDKESKSNEEEEDKKDEKAKEDKVCPTYLKRSSRLQLQRSKSSRSRRPKRLQTSLALEFTISASRLTASRSS